MSCINILCYRVCECMITLHMILVALITLGHELDSFVLVAVGSRTRKASKKPPAQGALVVHDNLTVSFVFIAHVELGLGLALSLKL